jgi:hypothetical protein
MMKRAFRSALGRMAGAFVLLAALSALHPLRAAEPRAPQNEIRLFNGHDLAGWETVLGSPAKGEPPLGRGHDPLGVFTVVQEDAAPAIRVSGQVWGALLTQEAFQNYRLHAQFKWGTQKWPPRQNSVRDSGILYHCVGEPDPHTGWMRSFECQIEEQDCGDFWSVRGAVAFAETTRMDTTDALRRDFEVWARRNEGHYEPWRFAPGGARRRIDKDGLMKSVDAEKPRGQWNDVDIYCLGNTSVHVINGVTNMILLDLSQVGPDATLVPLTRGKIQLQSEGAEVFYRDVRLEVLTPPAPLSPSGR